MKKEIKICGICNKEIKPKDNYCRLTDYKEGEFYSEGFYHIICYNNQLKRENPQQTAIKKLMVGTLLRANKLMNKAEEQVQ